MLFHAVAAACHALCCATLLFMPFSAFFLRHFSPPFRLCRYYTPCQQPAARYATSRAAMRDITPQVRFDNEYRHRLMLMRDAAIVRAFMSHARRKASLDLPCQRGARALMLPPFSRLRWRRCRFADFAICLMPVASMLICLPLRLRHVAPLSCR